ncbi:MAG: efflux RND transporter periplasmic adaptor subunit [Firmicutes bacterium]|nr:efflux RND transporter periplasmic adaptor subunit [Bacillota bacterium]
MSKRVKNTQGKTLLIVIILVLVAALGYGIYWAIENKPWQHLGGHDKKESKIEKIEMVVPVKAGKAVRKPVEEKLDITGSFDAWAEVTLTPQISAKVINVAVEIGSKVRKGEILVTLDPIDYKLQTDLDAANLQEELAKLGLKSTSQKLRSPEDAPDVKKTKAVMVNARINWERNVKMRKEELISDKDVEDSLRDYLTSKADFEAALDNVSQTEASIDSKAASLNISEQKLQYTRIKSPINGYVKTKNVEKGDYATPNASVLTLVQNDPIYLSVNIPQNFISKINKGKNIDLKTDAIPGKVFKGRITDISPAVDPDVRTILVRATIQNPENILKPGMYSNVSLITGYDNEAVVVPVSAIIQEMGETKVYVINKDKDSYKVSVRKVTRKQELGDYVQVKGDIKDGDMVATSSLATLVDGAKVTIEK